MPVLQRSRLILAKIETTYGTDSVPTGATDAILVRNLEVTPMEQELASRDLVRPYLGSSEQILAAIRATVSFEIEIAGAGTAGNAPAWAPLLRACAFAQNLLATAHTGTATAGAANSITLAAGASAVDNAYRGMLIRLTGGTGSGQQRVISAYNGTTKVATITPAWGVTPTGTTTYSIDAQASYAPVSTAFESVTLYFYAKDAATNTSRIHRMTGARGSVEFVLNAKEIPVMRFNFTGLYQAVADAVTPAVVYTAWQRPLAVNNGNTTPFSLHGFNAVMSQLSLNMNNAVEHRTLVGAAESVLITNRAPAGAIMIEGGLVAEVDWWTRVVNVTLGALDVTHGTVAGNRVQLYSGLVQLTSPQLQDLDGIEMIQFNTVYTPSTAGNDEVFVIAR
jgi:hypothetical protein